MQEGANMAKKGKSYPTNMYPQSASKPGGVSSLFERMEPLITPDLLKSRLLHDVPGLDTYSSDELQQEIFLACNEIELLLNSTFRHLCHRLPSNCSPRLWSREGPA